MLSCIYGAQKMKFSKSTEEDIAIISNFVRKGMHRNTIKARLTAFDNFDELYEVAAARVRNERICKTKHALFMTLDDLRFATNSDVAEYRAKRLKCDTIIDIGSGIGLQSFAFCKTCKKVYGIEIDERKASYAVENAKIVGVKNVEFIAGDALKVASKIKKADVVFCETARAPEAVERSVDELSPNLKQLMKIYGKLTGKFCIEIPPQTKEIPFDCEKEYVSVNHDLNRLNLYFGKLKKCETSAVALPSGARIEGTGKKEQEKSEMLDYLYEADDAVVKAGLTKELSTRTLLMFNEGFLTSKKKEKSDFFKNSFSVLGTCRNEFSQILPILSKEGCGKVVLRMKIDPDEYWNERKKYEEKLKGEKTLYLFAFGEKAAICEKI